MQNIKPLKIRLKEAMEMRGVKVPALSKRTGIPKDRIYAWYRDNTDPKRKDAELLEQWLAGEKPSENGDNEHSKPPGFVPADQVIADLRKDKEWLQAILNTSLATIVEGQQQTGIQLKALSWFSALSANGGDEKKAQEAMLKIGNKIAFYEGAGGEDDNSEKVDSRRTGGLRQRRQ